MAHDSAQPLLRPNGAPSEGVHSDKAFLEALDLSESEAANVLGRSRQSLSQARLASRTNYFRKADIASLVFQSRAKRPGLDLTAALNYVSESRGADMLEGLQTVGHSVVDEARLSGYKELWVVIPDLSYFNRSHPEVVAMLVRLGARADIITRFFASSSLDKALLSGLLEAGSAQKSSVEFETWMGAIPYLIIGDPHGVADSYLFAGGRYMQNDWYGGPKLALLIQSLLNHTLHSRQDGVGSNADKGHTGLIGQSESLGTINN
jgi:hypothetical protein